MSPHRETYRWEALIQHTDILCNQQSVNHVTAQGNIQVRGYDPTYRHPMYPTECHPCHRTGKHTGERLWSNIQTSYVTNRVPSMPPHRETYRWEAMIQHTDILCNQQSAIHATAQGNIQVRGYWSNIQTSYVTNRVPSTAPHRETYRWEAMIQHTDILCNQQSAIHATAQGNIQVRGYDPTYRHPM